VSKAFICIQLGILFLICSCTAPQAKSNIPSNDFTFDVTLVNNTPFDLEIIDNSRIIPRLGEKRITLPAFFEELNNGYRVNYRVQLLDELFISIPRKENIIIKQEQNTITIKTAEFESELCFLVLQNEGTQTISLKMDNAYLAPLIQWEPRQYGPTPYLGPGKTYVYEIKQDLNDMVLETDQYRTTPLILAAAKPGHIYKFLYKGNETTLTDSRPLHRVGEDAWVEPIEATETEPIQLVATKDEIHVFASTERGLLRKAYDSAGKVTNSSQSESISILTFAGAAEGGFFVAGYEELTNGDYLPIARINNKDGATRCVLIPSEQYGNERFLTVAQKDDTTWLLAGDGARNGTFLNTAYARLVRLEKNELKTIWEHGGNDFKGNSTINECRKITSAVYNHKRDSWLVTGENIDQNYFVAEISRNGTITVNHSFGNMLFWKVLIDSDGNCYLAGEEQIRNESHAVLIKYDLDNKRFTQIPIPHSSDSFFQDAITDTANNRIILGGIMKGVPFVEAVNIQTGKLVWREELSNPEIKKTGAVLVTGIVSAPDYGFALALSGIIDGTFGRPFIIARVNSHGKFIRRVR